MPGVRPVQHKGGKIPAGAGSPPQLRLAAVSDREVRVVRAEAQVPHPLLEVESVQQHAPGQADDDGMAVCGHGECAGEQRPITQHTGRGLPKRIPTHAPLSTDTNRRPLLEIAILAMSERFSAAMVVDVCLQQSQRKEQQCVLRTAFGSPRKCRGRAEPQRRRYNGKSTTTSKLRPPSHLPSAYSSKSNTVTRLPTGLNSELPSGVNKTFPPLYTVPHKLEN